MVFNAMNRLFTILSSGIHYLAVSLTAGAIEPLPDLAQLDAWKVPWEGRPRDPYVAPNGSVWFCGQAGNYLASFNPQSEAFERYSIAEGTHPHNLIVSAEGMVWYAGNRNGTIGQLDIGTGKTSLINMPELIEDPHTLAFDPEGNIWFTAQNSKVIALLDIRKQKVDFVSVPGRSPRPYGIKVAEDGTPWVALLGSHHIASVNARDFKLKLVSLPREQARPRRLEISSDGAIWYVDYAEGYLGRYKPQDDSIREWHMPNGEDSQPYGTALDDEGRLWIVETGVYPNQLVIFDTAQEEFISSSDVPGGGAVRHMHYDKRQDAIWFGVDSGYLARARLSGQQH